VDCSYTNFIADPILLSLFDQYRSHGDPITVNFRNLVQCLSSAERATHLIHPYPAKLLMHIPFFFLANSILSKPGDVVLDPFAGSGTVLLESWLAGRSAVGAECNPLGRLISKVKTTPLDCTKVEELSAVLGNNISTKPCEPMPDVINIAHWFYPGVIEQMRCILEAIRKTDDQNIRDFFMVCFSNCARKVSLADPRLNTPVRLKEGEYPSGHPLEIRAQQHLSDLAKVPVFEVFKSIMAANARRIEHIGFLGLDKTHASIICSDARHLHYQHMNGDHSRQQLPDQSVQLIITSPPYPGAQKYIRCSSISMGWLGICAISELRGLKSQTIGREEYRKSECLDPTPTGIGEADDILAEIWKENPIRATIAGTYLNEMRDVFREMHRVLRADGYMVLVAANNHVCKREFRTLRYLRLLAEKTGFSVILELIDHIRSRGLMTKRNHTANIITREGVLVLRKGG
jgi:DNA modification methylase